MKKYINYLFLFFSIATFASCLKDTQPITADGTYNVIEFGNIGNISSGSSNPIRLYIQSFPVVELDTVVATINYAGAHEASKDIHVKFSPSAEVLAAFNEKEYGDDEDSYIEMIPDELASYPTEVTIAKGTHSVSFNVIVKPDQFDFTKNFGLPLEITSADGEVISGNFGKIVLKLGAKNKYDADYRVTGSMTDPNGRFEGFYPTFVSLETVNSNTVKYYNSDFGYYYTIIQEISSGDVYLGDPGVSIVFDDDGNVTKIFNTPDGPGSADVSVPGTPMKFDFDRRSLHIKYNMGGWIYDETFQFSSER